MSNFTIHTIILQTMHSLSFMQTYQEYACMQFNDNLTLLQYIVGLSFTIIIIIITYSHCIDRTSQNSILDPQDQHC